MTPNRRHHHIIIVKTLLTIAPHESFLISTLFARTTTIGVLNYRFSVLVTDSKYEKVLKKTKNVCFIIFFFEYYFYFYHMQI